MLRGVRGAITVEKDNEDLVIAATEELLQKMLVVNNIVLNDLASIMFSATSDIQSEFPALAARNLGLKHVPLLSCQEMRKKGALKKCIRILMHWNTLILPEDIQHIYLKEADVLRPDLIRNQN